MDTKKIKWTSTGIRPDVIETGHRSDCDKELNKFHGTYSTENVCENVYRCTCGAAELRVNITTGEISKEKMA